jgi:hypothetical protein
MFIFYHKSTLLRYAKEIVPFFQEFWPVPEVCGYAIEQIPPAEVSAHTVGGLGK